MAALPLLASLRDKIAPLRIPELGVGVVGGEVTRGCGPCLAATACPASSGRPVWVSAAADQKRPFRTAALRPITGLALLPRGDEADDLRFGLHLPNDLADLVLRQFGFGETDAIELAAHIQRSLDHRGLVGAEEVGDVVRGRLRGKAHDGKGAVAGRARERGPARNALVLDHNRCDHGRLYQDCNRGGGRRPGQRARSEAQEELRNAAAEVERALPARRARLLGVDGGEQLLHGARRRRTERLVEMDCLRKLLADEIVAPREFAVAGERLLDAIGVAAAERPCRVPGQQSFDLVALWLFVDRFNGNPLSIPAALSSSASRLRA